MWIGIVLGQPGQIADITGLPFAPFAAGGSPRILVFVTSDCPISNGYAPDLQRLCSQYRAQGVRCWLVYEDLNIGANAVRRHLDEYRYQGMSAVIDRDGAIAARAGASITPQAVLVDSRGTIRYRGRIDNRYADLGKPRRIVTIRDLRDAVDAVLAGRAVEQPETTAVGCYISSRSFERKRP